MMQVNVSLGPHFKFYIVTATWLGSPQTGPEMPSQTQTLSPLVKSYKC